MKPKTSEIPQYYEAPQETFQFAKQLRHVQNESEAILWKLLRNRQVANAKFRRQHPIGPFIVDFYCHAAKLVIEVDGGIHNDPEVLEYDIGRQFEIKEFGITVLRFLDTEIIQCPERVTERIMQFLIERLKPFSLREKGWDEGTANI